jgi:lipid-A-disaccharide synthase
VPVAGPVDLLVIAGEHSGDEHAARMLREARGRRPGLLVAAVGGPRLAAAGAELLYDLTSRSALGFAVIGQISFYRDLIQAIVAWVETHRPRAVCFVDSSGLNLRIALELFRRGLSVKGGGATKTLYYISPQIWASRSGRRFKMAQSLDALAAIFPFEPNIYADTALTTEFVGHPFTASDYVAPVCYDPAGPVLLLPGSRRGAVSRIFPALLAGFAAARIPREAVVLYPSDEILAVLRRANPPATVHLRPVSAAGGPQTAIGASAVLTSSGTMSMHCALAGIPGAIVYRIDPLTYWLGRMLVKVKFLGIANLLLGEAMYPEYIQGAATPDALARELHACLDDAARRERTAEQATRLRSLLAQPATVSAGEWLVRQLG